jgi:hypothetical protein
MVMRMAADGNMRLSTVTSVAHLLATENHLSTKKSCFLMSLPFQLRRQDGFLGNAYAENERLGISVNDAEHGSVGNR